MKFIAEKFDAKYKGAKIIPIYVCTENPIKRRYVRYNQSGIACKRAFDQEKAIDRKNNLIECNEDCQYRQSEDGKTPACREELNFAFMIPDICQDRAFLLQTKSSNSLSALGDYFDFQKHLGNSIIGKYNLFLQECETTSPDGIRSTHYIYGIVKAEEQETHAIQTTPKVEEKSIDTIPEKQPAEELIETKTEKPNVKESTPKKKNPTKSKVTETQKQPETPIQEEKSEQTENKEKNETEKVTDEKMAKYHILLETRTVQLEKDNKQVDYLLGKFSNMKDEEVEAIIHTDYVEEFKKCELRYAGAFGYDKTQR